ncbi:MAG TPA: rhodanese [Desulfobulbus sp.]|nr:rhodanese [Desulfobulbus sp.]
MRVMAAGLPGWIRAGYATYASNDFVRRGNMVLIDLRPGDQDARARIPRSVSIPLARLEANLDRIPADAPIVLYGDSDAQARQGLKLLRRHDFRKVSLVEGNLEGWIRDGGRVVRGQPVTAITWQRRPAAGEVLPAEFRKAMKGATDTLLLDVRTDEETADGLLPGAWHIPLDQLAARMHELPDDKKIYVYSASGPRAGMARKILVKKGFRAWFLAARVRCTDGRCRIEKREGAGPRNEPGS